MALDPRYVVTATLEEYFVDNATGAPLAGGTIEFWTDTNRVLPKLVYELSGSPPNYAYTPLEDPVNISAAGTAVDNSGNPVSIYYFPYDSQGNIQLYYIVIKDQFGNVQKTLQAWPNITSGSSPTPGMMGAFENQIINPQFYEVLFPPALPLVITWGSAGSQVIQIGPGWFLSVAYSGAGNVTITRNPIAGNAQLPGNPPYTLTVTPGPNITSLILYQRLANNPDIWSPASGGANGWIASSIMIAPGNSVTMLYTPNAQVGQTILTASNISGQYQEFDNTVQLQPASNPSTGDAGYVDIQIVLPVGGPTTLSNVQVLGLPSNIPGVQYQQTPAIQQLNQMFYYYGPIIQAKPAASYTAGWDFPLNPTQALGPTVAAIASGANTSNYMWDQTIVFQSATSGAAASRSASGNGALRITASSTTQFALVQYLPQNIARKILQDIMSVNVSALTNQSAGISCTIGLYYTKSTLPALGSNLSIVGTLNADGSVATTNGTWFPVTRAQLGNATFSITSASGTTFNDYGWTNWYEGGTADVDLATFFAVVIGCGSLTASNYVEFLAVSLVEGGIPTRPAPVTATQALLDMQYYYNMSFNIGTVPAQNIGTGKGETTWNSVNTGTNIQESGTILFPVPMRAVPTTTLFNPAAANAQVRDETAAGDCSSSTILASTSTRQFEISLDGNAGTAVGNVLGVHWTNDARLGLV